MAKISDLSGDERAQRLAELKAKMQAAAKKNQAAAEGAEAEETAPAAPAAEALQATASAPVVEVVAAVAEAPDPVAAPAESASEQADEGPDTANADAVPASATVTVATNGASTNGASAAAALFIDEKSEEEKRKAEMNRREFLTYAWGASLGLLAVGGGALSFFFMYPRFRAGEFGGKFLMGPESSAPPADAAPIGMADGKFWWVTVEGEGPRAIYMVCTHLGCLYKWVGENNRFECPCHGSKFTREGNYIEGPAPRSLDQFVTTLEADEWVVDTGAKINGASASESPAAGTG